MTDGGRVRRSIPEFDAVNPASLDRVDQESMPDQDDPMDHQEQDLSQFSLGDHVGNLFRSHKSAKAQPKSQDRSLQGDLPLNVEREYNDALRSDEQYECYKQQNIEPPMSREDPRSRRKWAKDQDDHDGSRAMPIMDVAQPRRAIPNIDIAQGPQINYVPFVRSEILKESGKRSEQKDNTQDVNSLYSNPSQQYNPKVLKNIPNKKLPSEYFILKDQKVPIPIHVRANFPIYDDDIDFDPDPLQGILDERYWFDPRENEPVMKMNIDEPIDERAPFNYAVHQKRSVSDRYGRKKQYNGCYKSSKEADNPRKEIESCDECGKGKNGKKPNSTDRSDEGISYGRKLLSFVGNNNSDNLNNEHDLLAESYDYEHGDDEHLNPEIGSFYRSRKLLSFDNVDYYHEDFLLQSDTHKLSLKHSYSNHISTDNIIGRKILWYDEYDKEDESYNEVNEALKENSEIINESLIRNGLHSKELNNQKMNYDQQEYETSSVQVGSNNRQLQNQKYSVNKITDSDNEAKYYIPNKKTKFYYFDNYKSKTNLNKSNQISDNTISKKIGLDAGLKENSYYPVKPFNNQNENEDNSAYHDVSKKQELGLLKVAGNIGKNMISANKHIVHSDLSNIYVSNKIGDILQKEQQEKPKGPRKNEQIDPSKEFEIMRNETFKNASMGFTTFKPNVRVGAKLIHKRGNFNVGQKNRRSFTDDTAMKLNPHIGEASLLQGLGMPAGGSKTKEALSTQTTPSGSLGPNKNECAQQNITTKSSITFYNTTVAKNDDEESIDSKIANDIVESVIAETDKSSHNQNLGVCRRNESLMNIKFGKIIPETEKVIKFVTNCIMDKIKDHLAKQSCILLDEELIEFLKWIVLGGESYKEYEQKMGPRFFEFVPASPEEFTTCGSPTVPSCNLPGESLPPNPGIAQQALAMQQSAKDSIHAPKFSSNE